MTDWAKLKDAVRLMCREGQISVVVSNDFLTALDAGYRAEGEVDLFRRARPILFAEIQRLTKDRDAALDVLREVEWVEASMAPCRVCPSCHGDEPRHTPNCKLAAALTGTP